MFVIKNDKTLYVDVDETLVTFNEIRSDEIKEHIKSEDGSIDAHVYINHKNVAHLKKHAARGHSIFVWTHGGWAWAQAVVRHLHLEDYITLVLSKPSWYMDDLKSEEFLPEGNRIYFHE